MIKNGFYIVCAFLLSISGQNSYCQSKILRFDHLTTESGLPRNQVYSLLQDHIGYIWIGTGDGLSRYDGYRFKTFNKQKSNLKGNHVVSIYEDKKDALWVATNKGFSKFNKATENFENFSIDSVLISSGKNFYATKILEDNNNRMWIGSEKGLFLFNRKTKNIFSDWSNHILKSKLDKSRINALFQDSKGRLWVGTTNDGVFLISFNINNEVKGINNFIYDSNDFTSINHNRVDDIKEDKKGIIWFATRGGLSKLNKKNKLTLEEYTFHRIHNPFKKEVTYFDMLSSITIDQNNNLFVGYLNGLYYLPHGSNTLESIDVITNNPQLKHNYSMNAQFIDQTGVLWLTSSNGVYKHDLFLLKFNAHRANQDKPESSRQNQVWSILKDQDKQVWVGTSYGLNKLVWSEQTKRYEYIHIPNNAEKSSERDKYSIISMIEYDENHLLIGKRDGLFKFNKQNLFFTKMPFPANVFPSKMCMGEQGVMWIGTNKGIVKYNMSSKEYKTYTLPFNKEKYKHNNWTHAIHRDLKNRIWIGTLSGINVFFPEEEKSYFIDTNSNNEYKSVWTIHSDKEGNIWFGKWGDGLTCIIPNGEDLNFKDGYAIENFHVKDGLANDYVYSILPDEDENLWMSTNMGLSKFNPKTKQFENYTADEGLQSNEFNSGAYFKTSDGELLFGGPSGINSFYPSTISKNPRTPNVVITNVIVNGREIKTLRDGVKNELSKIVLKHDQNPLKFEFSELDYSNSSKNKYKIQLENYDNTWVAMNHNTSITYSKLPPGKYSFNVKGANHDGYWNENIISLNVEITSPYWKTWWFYALYALLLLSTIFLIFSVRLRQVKLKEKNEYFEKQNEEKKAVIKEIHHRIKNNLQVVISLLRMQSSKVKDDKVIDMFKETQKRILSMALLHEKMQQDDDLKGINVQEHLITLISGLIKSYAVGKDINLKVDIDEIDLGMETLTPLGLIVNELITNSLKHGFADKRKGLITVQIKQLKNVSFEMLIGDDGVGFNPKEKSSNLGTKLIEIFIKQLSGTITLLNQPGTMYKINFKTNNSN